MGEARRLSQLAHNKHTKELTRDWGVIHDSSSVPVDKSSSMSIPGVRETSILPSQQSLLEAQRKDKTRLTYSMTTCEQYFPSRRI